MSKPDKWWSKQVDRILRGVIFSMTLPIVVFFIPIAIIVWPLGYLAERLDIFSFDDD